MRNLSIDYLKMTLAVLIVILHTQLFRYELPTVNFLLVNGICRLGVPLFLIISGYYFFKTDNFAKYKHWFIRIGLLYLIWSIVYLPFWYSKTVFINNIIIFFTGYFILWYLLGVLLAGSLLYILKKQSSWLLLILAIICYFSGYYIQQAGNLHLYSGKMDYYFNWGPTTRNFLLFCFPMLTFGFLIHKHQLDKKIQPRFYWVVLSIIFVLLESFINYHWISKVQPVELFFSFVIVVPIIFIYIKNLNIPGQSKQLANLSTGIFLIHPLVMTYVIKYSALSPLLHYSLARTLLVLFISIIAGWGLIWLNKYLKYIL